jgi:hypothetical protein
MGQAGEGYCKKINSSSYNPNTPDSYVGGYYMGIPYMVLKQNECPQHMYILRDSCVDRCPDDMPPSSDFRCRCGEGNTTFQNSTCYSIDKI